MTRSTAVVTGGAGFIGSHLAEVLLERGYRVTILDDLCTGKRANIEHILGQGDVQFIEGSVTDLPLLNRLFKDVSYVFHLAAIPSVPRSIEDPRTTHEVNMTGTLNVLLAARDDRVKKVVYASSCAVYGNTAALPAREDMFPSPQSPYAVTKLAGEYYCLVFHQLYGVSTVCLRYFNVYGPRQDLRSQYAAVIPTFIDRLFKDEPPTVFGDGEQTRDFIFVKDVVDASILAAQSDVTGVSNIGTGRGVSINELARVIAKLMDKDSKPVYEKPRFGDVRHSFADIYKARQFGYDPSYSLEEGLGETVRGFGQWLA